MKGNHRMRRFGFEIAISLITIVLLGLGFVQVVGTAMDENRIFEAKLAANVPFMKITRSLSFPKLCQAKLLSSFQQWKSDSEFGTFEREGLLVSVKRSSRRANASDVTMADLIIPIPGFGERSVPIMLRHNSQNQIIDCMLDYYTARLEVGPGTLVTPACMEAPQNNTWHLRCPRGLYLARETNGATFKCCPLET